VAKSYYGKPYLDSGVFIAWIKGEVVKAKDAQGNEIIIERGKIGESILTLAESRVYPIIISTLTLVEVHKKKGKEKLGADENQNVLDYFQHDFVNPVTIDRSIGEDANRLCRLHEDKKLSPCDAIHLACAKKAGCDVLLSWDDGLNSVEDPAIRIERPRLQELPEGPLNEGSIPEDQMDIDFPDLEIKTDEENDEIDEKG
jgi:predicted nucleic acid-binding protein